MRHSYLLFILPILCGCATTPELPLVPEYHPAHADANQAPRIQAFDVLDVAPMPQPELPVPPAVELSPQDREKMQGMHSGHQMKHSSGGESENNDGKLTTAAPEGSVEESAGEHLHGAVEREGMLQPHPESMLGQGQRQDHPRPQDTLYKEQIDDDVWQMEAPMQPIKIPSEQRGMGTDSDAYHVHKHHDSTHITHPDRSLETAPIGGKQAWACPSHPKIVVETPGGRCPHCDTVLVPVRVAP